MQQIAPGPVLKHLVGLARRARTLSLPVASNFSRLSHDQSGQAMVEYVSLTTLLLLGGVAGGLGWSYTPLLLRALQSYVDLFLFAYDVAIG